MGGQVIDQPNNRQLPGRVFKHGTSQNEATGFVVDNIVFTNHHVVNASELEYSMSTFQAFRGPPIKEIAEIITVGDTMDDGGIPVEIVYTNAILDIAVLKPLETGCFPRQWLVGKEAEQSLSTAG